MSTNKTEYLQLHQWESGDDFSRAEINENFQKADAGLKAAEAQTAAVAAAQTAALDSYKSTNDAALAALTARTPRVAAGSYTGTGSAATPVKVNVGFAPQAVLVWVKRSGTASSYDPSYSGMAIRGSSLNGLLTVTDTGFSVITVKDGSYNTYPHLNVDGYVYFYLAIG